MTNYEENGLDNRTELLAEQQRLLVAAGKSRRQGRPEIARIQEIQAMSAARKASEHPIVETGRTDTLGRAVRVNQFGVRHWTSDDYKPPKKLSHVTADEWYRLRQIHGPVTCG